jgi:thiamine transport system substrate-binding protein
MVSIRGNSLKRFLFCLLIVLLLLASCRQGNTKPGKAANKNTLVLYCDDDFMSSGLGQKVIPSFEQRYKCTVEVITNPDAGLLIERLKDERNHPLADVVIGLNNTNLDEVIVNNLFESYHPVGAYIPKEFLFDPTYHLTPYGYGYMAIIYDSDLITDPPRTFGELQDAKYHHQLLVSDAYKSGIGRASLFWSIAAFGNEGYEQFWNSIRKNITQITPTWLNSKQLFRQDEGVMMIGLTTTPAYYTETLHNDRIKSFIPEEGSFLYMPAAGLTRKAHHAALGKKFLDFMISESFQKMIPETQWFYPIDQTVPTPSSFSFAPSSVITLNQNITSNQIRKNSEKWFDFWIRYVEFME